MFYLSFVFGIFIRISTNLRFSLNKLSMLTYSCSYTGIELLSVFHFTLVKLTFSCLHDTFIQRSRLEPRFHSHFLYLIVNTQVRLTVRRSQSPRSSRLQCVLLLADSPLLAGCLPLLQCGAAPLLGCVEGEPKEEQLCCLTMCLCVYLYIWHKLTCFLSGSDLGLHGDALQFAVDLVHLDAVAIGHDPALTPPVDNLWTPLLPHSPLFSLN